MDAILRPMRLSGNVLKIIAAFFMVIDHIGYILFPACTILRIIGRASFPIFAFMIAEGCCYTKNKRNYFLGIFILATLCQIFYYAYEGSTYMGILVTFSLSILLIYLLQFAKEKLFLSGGTHWGEIGAVCMFLLAVAAFTNSTGEFLLTMAFGGAWRRSLHVYGKRQRGISLRCLKSLTSCRCISACLGWDCYCCLRHREEFSFIAF